MPIASAARALPAITVMVTAGLSRPYIFRSFASGDTIFCICVDESDVSAASAAPKSARALYGFTIVQSPLLLASWIVLPSCAISTPSTLSWSNFNTALSRRSNGVRLKVPSRYDEIRNTRFSSGFFA